MNYLIIMPPHSWEQGAQCFCLVCRYTWRNFLQILQSCRLQLKDKRRSALIWDFRDGRLKSQGFWDGIQPTFVKEMSPECWEGFYSCFATRFKKSDLWQERKVKHWKLLSRTVEWNLLIVPCMFCPHEIMKLKHISLLSPEHFLILVIWDELLRH